MTSSAKPKIVLGQRPKHVSLAVDIPLPDGSVAAVVMRYLYRTRSEYGDMVDKLLADARAADERDPPTASYSEAERQRRVLDVTAEHILSIADGWDLDESFGPDSVRQLCDELPGGAQAIVDRYRIAIVEGRRGN